MEHRLIAGVGGVWKLFLDGDGEVQGRVIGFKQAAPFLAKLEMVEKARKEMPGLLAKLKANAGDAKVVVDAIQTASTSRNDKSVVLPDTPVLAGGGVA